MQSLRQGFCCMCHIKGVLSETREGGKQAKAEKGTKQGWGSQVKSSFDLTTEALETNDNTMLCTL